MAPWFGSRDTAAVGDGFTGRLNGVDDSPVAGTAAEVPVEGLGDGCPVACFSLVDERCRAYDDARNAEAALDAALEDEGLAHQPARVLGKSFEGDHLVAVDLVGLPQAGEGGRAVDQNQAAAAGAFGCATVLGRYDAAFLAEHLEEVHARLVGGGGFFPVQGEADIGHFVDFIQPQIVTSSPSANSQLPNPNFQ